MKVELKGAKSRMSDSKKSVKERLKCACTRCGPASTSSDKENKGVTEVGLGLASSYVKVNGGAWLAVLRIRYIG